MRGGGISIGNELLVSTMHDTIYAISLITFLLGGILANLGANIFGRVKQIGLSGRVDVVVLGTLFMAVWFYISAWILRISQLLNPHAPYWNSVIKKSIYAITFLTGSVLTSYLSDLLISLQQVAEFSLPTMIVLVFVGIFATFAFLIYFEESHGYTTFEFSQRTRPITTASMRTN